MMDNGHYKRKRCEGDENAADPYFRSYSDVGIHQEMIGDEVRTNTYRLAIMRNYESLYKKVVVDVGAGTGILSMFCVQAGAKKVYAIEASDMAEQAKQVIKANGMEDIITVIHGRVEDVELPEKVDVVVSEWMGYFLLYESMLQSVILARNKWLKKGGVMLPNKANLYLAPFEDSTVLDESLCFWDEVKNRYGLDMSTLKPYTSACFTKSVHVDTVHASSVMSQATEVCSLSLETIEADDLKQIQKEFSFDCFGESAISGFVAWFSVSFPKDTVLSTSPYDIPTHWGQCLLYIDDEVDVKQTDKISGSITVQQNSLNFRFLDIELKYSHNGCKEAKKFYSMTDLMD